MNDDQQCLQFILCGAQGHGKSTLLSSLADHCQVIDAPPAFLSDTLSTDYCCFTSDKRAFIGVDIPGAQLHTLATAALSAQLAIVVVDAHDGIQAQSRLHTYTAALLGVRQWLLVVNGMDRVEFDLNIVDTIAADYRAFAQRVGIDTVEVIPVSALTGAHIVQRDGAVSDYTGPALLTWLENTAVNTDTPVPADNPGDEADQFAAHIVWTDKQPLLPERPYAAQFGRLTTTAQITDLVHRVDVETRGKSAIKTLGENQIGYCKLALDRAVAFDTDNAFTLSDKYTHATLGVGVIDFALRRASNIEWHDMKVDKAARARANRQTPCVLWFTGLSGSGKSTIADRLEQQLHALGKRTYLMDGDNVRHGLNKDLGFTDQDRVENIRRIAEVAKLMVDAGLIVLTSFISPFRAERQMARDLMGEGEFIEVFVDTPLAVCEQRDPKGLYKKARSGALKNFTGIDSDYQAPDNAEIVLKSGEVDAEVLAGQVVAYLQLGEP